MDNTTSFNPKWVLWVSWFMALMAMIVTATLLFAPGSALDKVDLQAQGVGYLISMWAARQFAIGVIFAYAAYRQSATRLKGAYLFFGVMNVGDFIIGVVQGDKGLIIGALIMCLLSGVIIFLLRNKTN